MEEINKKIYCRIIYKKIIKGRKRKYAAQLDGLALL